MKALLFFSFLFCGMRLASAQTSDREVKAKALAVDPRVVNALRKNGFRTQVPAAVRSKDPEYGKPPAGWPVTDEREKILGELPELAAFAAEQGWDEYSIDEFISRAAADSVSVESLGALYRRMNKDLLSRSIVSSRRTLSERR